MKKNAAVTGLFILHLFLYVSSLAQTSSTPFSFGVKIYGQGKPMILIPGLNGDGPATYATTVAHFKDHYKCYVITLAGFAGQPASQRDSELLKGQRDELICYVKEQHLNKPVLVGFSFGGVLALWMETTAPDLFGKLVGIDGVPFEDAIEKPNLNIDSLRDTIRQDYDYIRTFTPQQMAHRDSVRHSPKNEKAAFEFLKSMISDTTQIQQVMDWDRATNLKASWLMQYEMETLDMRDDVAKIQSPILVLGSWIGWDSLKTKELVEAAYKKQFAKAKNCKIVFSEQGKHFLMWNDYNWYIHEIDNFLKRE